MPKIIDQDEALKLMREVLEAVDGLRSGKAGDAKHTRWVMNTQNVLKDIFGDNSTLFLSFGHLTWAHRGSFIVGGHEPPEVGLRRLDQEAYLDDLETARGLLQAGIDQIERVGIENVYAEEPTISEIGDLVSLVGAIKTNLRKAMHAMPDHEHQVQDALETIFHVLKLDFKREKERVEYSGKTSQPDFTLAALNLALEVKLVRKEADISRIIDEMNADLVAYQTGYPTVLFIVYDLGAIRDVDTFRAGFVANKGVLVEVVKH